MQINPVFENALPRLTDEEFRQLEDNIVSAGEVFEPIVLWGDVIVDGHNRWAIIQKHPEVKYKTRQAEFESEWHALEYIYSNQMGKRNLTTRQKTYALGKLYEARKQIQGGMRDMERDEQGHFTASRRNRDLPSEMLRTNEKVANEQGVAPRTVDTAYLFSRGVDKAEEDFPGFREAVTSGKVKASLEEIGSLSKMDDERRKKSVEALLAGERLPKEHKEYVQPTEEITFGSAYTVEDFKSTISTFPDELESSIRHFLDMHEDMLEIKKCKADFILMLNTVRAITDKYEEVANEH